MTASRSLPGAPTGPRRRCRRHHRRVEPAATTFPARWVGRRIDKRYRIVRLVAESSMGAMFVAEHIKLRKQVALKMIPETCSTSTSVAKRFGREALMTARIDNPHVVGAIDYGRLKGGGAYLVTELADGESLACCLARGPLPWATACRLGGQIADAMVAAHAVGVVHRGLEPENIMLVQRDDALQARVVDFGIAHVSAGVSDDALQLSNERMRVGKVLGTPGYMAPEQTLGAEVDGRADLYALGVILWECCAGRRLWSAGTPDEVRAAQSAQAAPSLREACPAVPEAFAAVVDRLLARGVDDRPADALVVREALRALYDATGDALASPEPVTIAAIEGTPTDRRGLVMVAALTLLVSALLMV